MGKPVTHDAVKAQDIEDVLELGDVEEDDEEEGAA